MKENKRDGLVGGLILIGIGVIALLAQFVDFISWESFGVYFLLLLGCAFLLWGILSRQAGPMIPGGILSGIGLGTVMLVNEWAPAGMDEGGVFLVVFGLGWFLITGLTAVFTNQTQWWALIPGGIIGFVGLSILFGGVFVKTLAAVSVLWPVVLIIAGAYVLWKARGPKDKTLEE
ncbi:MAG: hypothetical protein R6X34_23740 [Chloroflexota bacterium]